MAPPDRAGGVELVDGPCPVCGSDRHRLLSELAAEPPAPPGPWRTVVCGGCDSYYLRPRPARPESLYGAHYHVYRQPGRLGRWTRAGAALLEAARLARHAPRRGAAVYEIGCGTGEVLAALARLGFRVSGIEASVEAARAARSRGLEVDEGAFSGGRGAAGAYDLVLAAHVIEHVPDPQRFLADLRRILRPGGRALLKLPVAGSLDVALFGAYSGALDLPYHLFVPARAALRRLVGDAGLLVEAEHTDFVPNDWVHGLRRAARGGLGLPLPFVRPWNPLVALPLLPLSVIAGLLGRPGRMVLVVSKPG